MHAEYHVRQQLLHPFPKNTTAAPGRRTFEDEQLRPVKPVA